MYKIYTFCRVYLHKMSIDHTRYKVYAGIAIVQGDRKTTESAKVDGSTARESKSTT